MELRKVEEVITEDNVRDHEEKEINAKSTDCPECGKVFSLRGNMLTHYRSIHEGIKYPCNQCDSQFTQQSNLQTHIHQKHQLS